MISVHIWFLSLPVSPIDISSQESYNAPLPDCMHVSLCPFLVVRCLIVGLASTLDNDGSSIATPLCTIAKPLAWYRDESFGSVLGKRTDDE